MHGNNKQILSSAETKLNLNWFNTFMEHVFLPVQSKFLKAINNKNLIMWIGIYANIVSKNHPTHVTATLKDT